MTRAASLACLACALLAAGCGARTGILIGDAGVPVSPVDLGARDAGVRRDLGVDADTGLDAGPTPCDLPPTCGGGPCGEVIEDEEVFALPETTNDIPTIALDERGDVAILAPATGGGAYVGYLVRRSAGVWSTTTLAPMVATGALATGAPGPLVIEAYDGAFGNTLWTERGGMLVSLADVPTDAIVQAGGVVRDGDGSLHMLGEAGTGRASYAGPTYVRRHPAGAFDSTMLPDMPQGVRGGAIAVDGNTTPWVAWRTRTGGPTAQIVEAWSDLGDIETVATTTLRDGDSIALRLAAAGSMVWLAYVDGTGSLRLLRRDAPGTWHNTASSPARPGVCGAAAPCLPLVPLGVVADCGASAHAFYFRAAQDASDVPHLESIGSDGSFTSASLMLANVAARGGTVVRDASGDVHVAYLVEDDLRHLHVRYARWVAGP